MGHGEIGDDPRALGELDDLLERATGGQLVGVRDLHALGRPGGARGVDQGEHVVGLDGAPRGLEVEVLRCPRLDVVEGQGAVLALAVDDHDVLEVLGALGGLANGVEEGTLGHDHAALGVAGQVLDLLGRVGVVDREGRGAQMHGGGVDPVVLGPVGEHDGERVPARDPEAGEAGGGALDPLGVLGPGDGELVALGADGRTVAGSRRRRPGRPRTSCAPRAPGSGRPPLAGCSLHRLLLGSPGVARRRAPRTGGTIARRSPRRSACRGRW